MLTLTEAQNRNLELQDEELLPASPPHGFVLFLTRLGLENALEKPHPAPKSITLEELEAADKHGERAVQAIKNDHLQTLIKFRSSPPHRLGVPMKLRAQAIIQKPRGFRKEIYGDSSTWVINPLDRQSCRAITAYQLKKGRTKLWMSFAMTGDITDPLSRHKDQRAPLLGHEVDPISGRSNPITTLSDLEVYLDSAEELIWQERIYKLSRKLAKVENPDYSNLSRADKQRLHEQAKPIATQIMDLIRSGEVMWSDLTVFLANRGQRPLDEHDHALIKLFPQDNPYWKIGDIMLADGALVLEFSADQFTPREKNDSFGTKPTIRIIITQTPDGQPVIVLPYKDQLPYLFPFLNSKKFWRAFDHHILPQLGTSPYHNIQFMYHLGIPNADITLDNLASAMGSGHVSFIVDMIAGLVEKNNGQSHPLERNGSHNQVYPFITNLDIDNLDRVIIRHPQAHDMVVNNNYLSELYSLMTRCAHIYRPFLRSEDLITHHLTEADISIAQTLLLQRSVWEKKVKLPPSTFAVLEEIVQYGQPRHSVHRTLTLLENQVGISELPDPKTPQLELDPKIWEEVARYALPKNRHKLSR